MKVQVDGEGVEGERGTVGEAEGEGRRGGEGGSEKQHPQQPDLAVFSLPPLPHVSPPFLRPTP